MIPFPSRTNALFLTGVPGAGKTTAVLANRDQFPQDARIVYEGQLADPVYALPKFEAALAKGLNIEIMAIHVSSEQALTNTILRFEREGRGATIEALARIQGNLPNGLKQIYARFGDEIGFTVVDKRDIMEWLGNAAGRRSRCLSRKETMSTSNKAYRIP